MLVDPGFFRASAIFSSVLRIAFCSSDWASTQSRMICCSERMFLTRPEMPSARLAMAVATRGLEPPPFSCMLRSLSDKTRISSEDSVLAGSATTISDDRSVTEDSQFSSSV